MLAGAPDPKTTSKLMPLLYDELRGLARAQVHKLAKGRTLQATELVHEAWMRVRGGEGAAWDGRAHFFGAAAAPTRVGGARWRTPLRPRGYGCFIKASMPLTTRLRARNTRTRSVRELIPSSSAILS